MRVRYLGDINARARGLRTHLLPASDLERLASSSGLAALQRELEKLGFALPDGLLSPERLERAIRQNAAADVGVLERWCTGPRRTTLAVVFEDEDRRSIQAILRGAEQGIPSEVRMTGLIPTQSLPERALRALASQPTPADVVRLLVLWKHPLGIPLVAAAGRAHPSLFEMEVELERAFAARALARAHEGGRQLIEYVQQVIDVSNAWSALLHFVERDAAIVDLTFVSGGRWITREALREVMGLETIEDVQKRIAQALRKSPVGRAFSGRISDLATLETDVLRAQIDWQKRAVRLDPSGAASVIGFALELRAQVLNLRRILWGVALEAPPALIQDEMVIR